MQDWQCMHKRTRHFYCQMATWHWNAMNVTREPTAKCQNVWGLDQVVKYTCVTRRLYVCHGNDYQSGIILCFLPLLFSHSLLLMAPTTAAIGIPALIMLLAHYKSLPLAYTFRSWWLLRSLVKQAKAKNLEPERKSRYISTMLLFIFLYSTLWHRISRS